MNYIFSFKLYGRSSPKICIPDEMTFFQEFFFYKIVQNFYIRNVVRFRLLFCAFGAFYLSILYLIIIHSKSKRFVIKCQREAGDVIWEHHWHFKLQRLKSIDLYSNRVHLDITNINIIELPIQDCTYIPVLMCIHDTRSHRSSTYKCIVSTINVNGGESRTTICVVRADAVACMSIERQYLHT